MSIGSELLRFQKDQKYMIFDKETEGVNLLFSRPWQVSWLVATLSEISESYDYFPWFSDLKVSKVAARITRFDYNEYKQKATDPHEVLKKFEEPYLDESIIKIGHNIIGFDNQIYRVWRKSLGLPINDSIVNKSIFIDTNNIAKAQKKGFTIPDIRSKEFAIFNYKMSLFHEKNLKTNLPLLGKEYGIEFDYDSVHRGNNDILLNRLVWNKMIYTVEL
jgi:hypothetical protein